MPRLLVLLLLTATTAGSLFAWQEYRQLEADAPVLHKAAVLESENDALRDALQTAERAAADAQNAVRRSQIEREASEIRGLPFKEPVVYDFLDRAGIRQVVAEKMSKQYTDQEIENMATGLSAFGLLPPHFPLKKTYIDLLGEQIAAFYDQHQHKLFMFRDATLENAQNRVILAHELTHALQDQNFGLLKLPIEIKDNDDEAAAASALIEGDATLVMSQYMAKDLTWRTLADTVTYSATQSMDQIRRAPRYLREMLVFPYLSGQQFCAAVYARGGFEALSAAYAHPPASTAQILHPEKYFAETREDPIPVAFPGTTFNGEKPLDDNVLGEMGARILFAMADPESADAVAAGWRGDRYLVYQHGDDLVWKTEWNSPAAATAAAGAFQAICGRRFDTTAGHPLETLRTGPGEIVFVLAASKQEADLLGKKFAPGGH
jgi:hypothetical protein